jgi:phosphatidylinositol glycan class S
MEASDAVFGSEERTIRQLLDSSEDPQGMRKVQDQLKTVKYAPGYQLTFSLFSGDASNGVREWKMQETIDGKLLYILFELNDKPVRNAASYISINMALLQQLAYLSPFIKTMSTLSEFTIESQIQHYASLAFTPQLDNVSQEHYLTPDSLPNFINAAEWSLGTS